jgi:hypothetical protein
MIERALLEGAILRTHALRGTWQLVTPKDIRWILSLVAPSVLARFATRHGELELDAATFRRSHAVLEKALRGGTHLTRDELAASLRKAGISTDGQRLAHLLVHAELDGLICSGARRGKKATYALLDDRAPNPAQPLAREDALREIARRYFTSRGPATLSDFAWWSGLRMADARAGLESVESTLIRDAIDGRIYFRSETRLIKSPATTAHLLPAFDEYLVSYRNREAVLEAKHVKRLNAGGGMLDPCFVLDGRVVGTWRRTLRRKTLAIELRLFDRTLRLHQAFRAASARYEAFVGCKPEDVQVLV